MVDELSPAGQLRALYLMKLIQLKKPHAECEQIWQTNLQSYQVSKIQSKLSMPVAFFHMDNNESGAAADPVARSFGLVRGVDFRKIRQMLAGKLA